MNEEIKKAMEVLSQGGLLLLQTDTGLEIACDATQEKAVNRLLQLRKTNEKYNVVLVDSPVKVEFYVREVPEIAWDLLEVADKPLVLVFSGIRNLPEALLDGGQSLGIRLATGGFAKMLCERYRKALFCTPATQNGKPLPSAPEAVSPEVLQEVDFVVPQNGAPVKPVSPSVIRLESNGQVKILKP